jgi:uncharacterized RDD family membrane protein YckC
MSPEPSFSPDSIPSLALRVAAKAIDFVAVGFTVVGFSIVTHSYLAGVLIGYGWLALSDWGGSLGKWITKLAVRDHETGAECSAQASMVRNLPIIATALPHKLHQALLGMDRQQYREAHSAVILLMGCLALLVLGAMLVVASRNAQRRHLGDFLARTVVVFRKREPSSISETSS